jgi:hypothetical protein
MSQIETRIERQMRAEGFDIESDEGAMELQRRLDQQLQKSKRNLLVGKAQGSQQKIERVRGIMI